jgi:hypothetical protein
MQNLPFICALTNPVTPSATVCPRDVRSKFKRREIKIALGTYSFNEARNFSRLISSLIQNMIEKIRGGQPVTLLSNDQILKSGEDHFLSLCAADASTRIWPGWGEHNTECVEALQ